LAVASDCNKLGVFCKLIEYIFLQIVQIYKKKFEPKSIIELIFNLLGVAELNGSSSQVGNDAHAAFVAVDSGQPNHEKYGQRFLLTA